MAYSFGPGIIAERAIAPGLDLAKDWPWLLAALGWIVAIIAGMLLLVRIVRMQRLRLRKRCSLQIANTGNVRDRYELRVEEATGEVSFEFRRGRDVLPERQISRVVPIAATVTATRAPAPVDGTAPPAVAAPADPAQQPAGKSAAAAAGRASEAADQARGAVGGIAGLLDTLGLILPGSIGQGLRRTAYNMNIKQGQAGRLAVQPKRQLDRVKKLRGQARSVAPIGAVRTAPHTAGTAAAEVPPTAAEAAHPATRTVMDIWAQTPWIEPSAAVNLTLCITPVRRPTQDLDCAFRLVSRSVEQAEATPTISANRILLHRFSWFRLYWPALALGVLLTAVLSASFYVLWIVRFGALLGAS